MNRPPEVIGAERVLRRRALRIIQTAEHPLFLFTLAANEIADVADVARIGRDEADKLIGYQRPEKKQHVRQIQAYLDEGSVLFPNGLILALPETIRFISSRGPGASDGFATAGTIEIPLPLDPDAPRPAWIVDGQQRSLALARTSNGQLAVPVAGFLAPGLEVQRDQFLRVNNVHPLPPNLVTELLPEISSAPSPRLAARKLPAALVEMLNQDPASPFKALIRRASTGTDDTHERAVKDTSLLEGVRESIESSSGVLFPYRNPMTGLTDTEGMRSVLLLYWNAVRDVFKDAWALPPTKSRLMHGAGIRSMSRLMDVVMPQVDLRHRQADRAVRCELERIASRCHWTAGQWDELGLAWNGIQNNPRHISLLSSFLIRAYIDARATLP